MQSQIKRGKIDTNQRWLVCPRCGRGKVQKLLPDTEAKRLVVYCKQCGKESVVNISPLVPAP